METALSKFQCLLANALVITGFCHLLVIKRFHAKFLELATARPRDQHLRAPTIHEVIDAERAAWQSVSELMTEGKWTLNDSLSEVAYCRQVFHTCLAPRPKAIQPQQGDDRRRKRLPSPKAAAKTKAKPQPKQESPSPEQPTVKYQEGWAKKTQDGRGIWASRAGVPIRHPSTKVPPTDLCQAQSLSQPGNWLLPIRVLALWCCLPPLWMTVW